MLAKKYCTHLTQNRRGKKPMDTTAPYSCPYCGEESFTEVDLSQGLKQSTIEDCQVCCRPMTLFISFDEETYQASINAEPMD
jgi:transcription elongation factor Elf1